MIKKILLILLALFLAWAIFGFVRAKIFSNRAGQLIRSTKPFEQKGTTGQKVLVLGDSLAYGTGTSHPDKSVAGLIAREYYPEAEVINKSVNGKRTTELAAEIQNLGGRYDLIIIVIGGNDILRPWISLDNSAKNLETIYKQASNHSERVVAFTTGNFRYTTFFVWPLNLYYEKRSITLRNSALEIAAKYSNLRYVDMVERNKTVPFDHIKEAPDHLHLSDYGARYWLEALVSAKVL